MTRWSSAALALALVLATAPAPAAEFNETRACMGTLFQITIHTERPDSEAKAAADTAFELAASLDACLSDYRADSEVGRFHRSPAGTEFEISETLADVLVQATELAEATDKAFDPARGALTRLWRMAKRTAKLPSARELTAAREASGLPELHFDPTKRTLLRKSELTRLDFGGIAKGYAADRMLESLSKAGFTSASIAAGGDLRFGDPPPGKAGWEIAIRPAGSGAPAAMILSLKNAAVSTSGSAEQEIDIGGKAYSHIINPTTGLGLDEPRAACVIAPSATESDALATAIALRGKPALAVLGRRKECHGAVFSPSSISAPSAQTPRFDDFRLRNAK